MNALILLLGLLNATAACDAGDVTVRGQIRDADGTPLSGATISLAGNDRVAVSAADGSFELCAGARRSAVLLATRRGYQAEQRRIDLDRDLEVRLAMPPAGYFDTIDVTSRRSLEEDETIADSLALPSLDVLRTPGTYADVFRRAQMLPGVSKLDEGAGLFVRGGDVHETATYLDRALLAHPYRLETPTGGFFGTVPPWLISGLALSAGGFPARYGNALSAVLELDSLPRPTQPEVMLTAGLAAVSARLSLPLGDTAGIRFSGNHGDTRTLFEVNDVDQEYRTYPASRDWNLGLYFESPSLGRLEAFGFQQRNEIGLLDLETQAFRGPLDSDDDNRGVAVSWQRALRRCCLATLTASASDHSQRSAAGVLDVLDRQRGERLRLDVDARLARWTLRFGGEWERTRVRFAGDAPEQGGDLDGLGGTRLWQLDFSNARTGAWLEAERAFGAWEANFGLRADHFSQQGAGVDPRLALTWTPRPRHRLRLAAGLYHQAPEPQTLDEDFGNPELPLMRARHLVLGYRYREAGDPLHLRVEVYDKDYDDLPLESPATGFSAEGGGWARGLDLLISAERGRWSGWLSYSAVHSRRRSTRWIDFGRYPVPDRPVRSPLAVPHTLQLSSQWALPSGVSLGGSFRWATGQPFTSVVGATEADGGYLPVYGEIAAERYPDFRRLDLSLAKSLPFLDSGLAVLFLGASNFFDRQSTFRYVYNPDYSERSPARTSFGRTFYLGITIIR